MKRIWLIALWFPVALFSQDKKTIDSINDLPFDAKVNRAPVIDTLYLKNAANAKKLNYVKGLAGSYSNLGLIYYYQGKYGLNVGYRLKAIKLYELLGAKDKIAYEYGELGYSMKRRNMAKAQYYMQKGKQIAEKDSIFYPLMGIYDNYGVLKEMQNQLDSALYFYNKSLRLKERENDSIGIPYSLNNIAGVYVMQKRFDAAKPLYERGLKIREMRKDEIGMSENYSNVGNLYFEKKAYQTAIANYKKSLDFSLKNDYIFGIQSMYKSLADCYDSLKNPSSAYENYKLYSRYKDSLLNKETNAKIAELEVRFETGKKEKLLLEKLSEIRQRNLQVAAISIIALFVAVIGFLVFRQQKLKNRQQTQQHELRTAIAQIESQSQLQNQRLDISRDLHDNIGAQLTFIISSMDNIRYAFDLKDTKLDLKLQSISSFTRETIVELRDTIWAINHNDISFEDLRARILNFIEKAKESGHAANFRFAVSDELSGVKLTSVQGMNVYRAIQEAVNNALKYAGAKEISIEISCEKTILVTITDDGKGFDESNVELGNGILNMQKRIEGIGGQFSIWSKPGEGTKITMALGQLKNEA